MENYNPQYQQQYPPQYQQGGYQRQVDFKEAVLRGFNNYCTFSGRASRSEYWWWALFSFCVSLVAEILDKILGVPVFTTIAGLGLLLPGLGLACRRLHDIGKAAGWIFLACIPLVGVIILLVWFCKESEMFPNRFGNVPNMV